MPTQNFLNFLDQPTKTLIYLLSWTTRYVSGGAVLTEVLRMGTHGYNTTAAESPANTPFRAVLSRASIPPLRREISLPFKGTESKPGFGNITIINVGSIFSAKFPPTREWEGGETEIRLTGPRSQLALADSELIFRGVAGKPKFSQSVIEAEVFSRHRELERRKMPTATFTAPNGELRLAPLAFGVCKNVTPPLKDAVSTTNIIYKPAGHALEDITAVYDKGVALTLTTQWTKDLPNGEFALKQAPVGIITCDLKGMKFGSPATFSAKRGDFILWALENPGAIAAADTDDSSFATFNADVAGDSGIYVTEEISVLDFCNKLLEPVMGFLLEDRSGIFSVGILKLPTGTPVLTLSPAKLLPLQQKDLIEVEPGEPLLYKTILQYDENGTEMTDGDLGSSGAVDPSTEAGRKQREWLKSKWRPTEKSLTGATQGRNLFPTAGEQSLESFFRNKADADTFAQRWLDFFGQSWAFYRCMAKVQPFALNLHNVVRISDGTGQIMNKDTRVIMLTEDYQNNRVELLLFAKA